MDIALRKEGISRSARADMRDAPGIAMDLDLALKAAQADGAFGLRQT